MGVVGILPFCFAVLGSIVGSFSPLFFQMFSCHSVSNYCVCKDSVCVCTTH
uniref:Uncharacterized protein n=1 Tax=Arundo donax TaxID=35708 RepID=A0A0A9EJD9_ARUDO